MGHGNLRSAIRGLTPNDHSRMGSDAVNCTCKLSLGNKIIGLPDHLKPRIVSGLTKAELDSVLSIAKHRKYRSSSVIISEEDPADRLYLLTSGYGRHFVITGEGQRILLQWLTAGQIFGGAAILSTPTQYLAYTEVLSDSCVLVWDRKTIRQLATRCTALLDNALSIAVTENIAWCTAAHISLSSNDARRRIAHLLISLSSAIGRPTHNGVAVKVLNEELAEGANVTRFTVSRCLVDWERKGIVKKHQGTIILRKPELLLATT